MNIPKQNEKIAGINIIKFLEKPDRLMGIISLVFSNLTKKKIPENKKINGDIEISNVGIWIKDKLIDNKNKLLVKFLSLKKNNSSKNVINKINEKIIDVNINNENKNSFNKYLIIIFGVCLFILFIYFLVLKFYWVLSTKLKKYLILLLCKK